MLWVCVLKCGNLPAKPEKRCASAPRAKAALTAKDITPNVDLI